MRRLGFIPLALHRTVRLLVRAATAWQAHRASTMGASIAFYTLFSMGPVLFIAITIAGYAFGHEVAQSGLLSQVQTLLGHNAAQAVGAIISSTQLPGDTLWRTALAVLTSLFAATTVFSELKNSLDVIWELPPNRRKDWPFLIRSRLLSFGVVLGVGFILLASLLLSAVVAAVEARYGSLLGSSTWLLKLVSNLCTTVVVTALFAAIFKLLPEEKVAWRDVWRGALLTACLYMLGKSLIAVYLGTTALASAYGAAGALVLILLWIYYSAQVFLYGAELSRQMALMRAEGQASYQ
ncbi:YihY/virulence factor BrkB family protein [Chitinimonas naiadis]